MVNAHIGHNTNPHKSFIQFGRQLCLRIYTMLSNCTGCSLSKLAIQLV